MLTPPIAINGQPLYVHSNGYSFPEESNNLGFFLEPFEPVLSALNNSFVPQKEETSIQLE